MFDFTCENCIHFRVCKHKEKNLKIINELKRQELCLEPNTLIKADSINSTLKINCIYKE